MYGFQGFQHTCPSLQRMPAKRVMDVRVMTVHLYLYIFHLSNEVIVLFVMERQGRLIQDYLIAVLTVSKYNHKHEMTITHFLPSPPHLLSRAMLSSVSGVWLWALFYESQKRGLSKKIQHPKHTDRKA